MPYGKTICSVNNCLNYKGKPMLRFPSPAKQPVLFGKWINAINNKDLSKLPPLKVYKCCRICTRHFEDKWINSVSGRKLPGAVPNIFYTREEEINLLKQKSSQQSLVKDVIQFVSDDSNIDDIPETINEISNQISNISDDPQPLSLSHCHKIQTYSKIKNKKINSCIKTSVQRKDLKLKRIVNVTSKSRNLYQYRKILERKYVGINKIDKYRYSIFENAAKQGHLYSLYKKFRKYLNKNADAFLVSQIKKCGQKQKSCTLDEQIVTVSILKSFQGLYKYMIKYFHLSDIKSLKELLRKVPYAPGANINLQIHVEKILQNINVEHRTCVLMFKKIPIRPHLTYDVNEDQIWGFENMGMIQKPAFAEYALIFLLRGLSSNRWKLPYAFMFIGKDNKTSELIHCINTVLKSAFLANFNVVATISDQNRQNVAAMKYLKQKTRMLCISEGRIFHSECYEFEGNKIVHLYNPIQLLKEFRDKFLTNNIAFTMDNKDYEASWSDIENFYKHDQQASIRQCYELTEQCVLLDKIDKNDLTLPAKALSRSVYSAITHIVAEMSTEKNVHHSYGLKHSAIGTAKLILFVDELYDSFSGTRAKDVHFRPLRDEITVNSNHWIFWEKAKVIMQSMKLINRSKHPHLLENWFVTLNSIEYLFKRLTDIGISSLDARILNLDPLDDLIGNIKILNSQQNPTVCSFISSFRTLSINNFNTSLFKPNVKNDDDVLFVDVKSLLTRNVKETNLEMSNSQIIVIKSGEKRIRWAVPKTSYVAKYVARKILQLTDVKTCNTCIKHLLSTKIFIQLSINELVKPKTKFMYYIKHTIDIIFTLLPQIGHCKHVTKTLVQYLKDNINFTVLSCNVHSIADTFSNFIVKFCIYIWCKRTNSYLKGQNKRPSYKLDPIQLLSVQRYEKSLRKPRR